MKLQIELSEFDVITLKRLRAHYGENDATGFEQNAYTVLNNIVKQLDIDDIDASLPSVTSPEFKKWLDENGYKKEPVDFLVRKGDTAYSVHHLYQHYTNVLLFGNKR